LSISIEQASKNAIRVVSPWVEWLARLGFAAKGVVYVIIGAFTLQLVFGAGGDTQGTEDTFRTIAQEPFGQFLLGLVALGLLGYAIWQFVRTWMGSGENDSDLKDRGKRIAYTVNGVIHLVLAFVAARILMGNNSNSGGGNSTITEWTASIMSLPFGQLLVGFVGLCVIGAGLYRIYKAYTIEFQKKLKLGNMDATKQKWTIRLGRLGLAAQAVVFMLIGSFLVQAAVQYEPSEARGLEGALNSLLEQPFGSWLLGIVAAGLVAHGIYMGILSRYRRIEVS
jgi:hypothetical protein